MSRCLLLFALLFALAGCRGASPEAYPGPGAAPHSPATRLPYPAPAQSQGLLPPYPSPQRRAIYPLPGDQPPGAVTNPTPLLEPTPFPTLAPDRLRPTLLGALQVTQAAPGAYQIGDWHGGWRSESYCRTGPLAWLDDNHLLLFPLTGLLYDMGPIEYSVPLVANLAQGTLWMPYPPGEAIFASGSCADQPAWSAPAGILAAPQPERIYMYGIDGDLLTTLPYQAYDELGVSPSGRWLFTGQEFFDLGAEAPPGPQHPQGWRYAWDPAEGQIFACCNISATRFSLPINWQPEGIIPIGRGVSAGGIVQTAAWTPDGRYTFVFWDYQHPLAEGAIVPLFDPGQQTYGDLLELVGLRPGDPAESWCRPMAISPDGRQLLLACQIWGWYLVNLETYQASTLGDFTSNDPSFSANGEFLVNREALSPPGPGRSPVQFWRTEDSSTFFFELPHGEAFWHPTRPWLALTHSGEGGVTLFDARQRKVLAEIETVVPVRQALWSPQGDGLLLAREDGRLAWLADPLAMQTPISLNKVLHTEPRGLQISPDGRRAALVDDRTVYIYPLP